MAAGNGDELTATPSVAKGLSREWAMATVAVVVPIYDEATNLPVLAERVLGLPLPNLTPIVVDDNSPDGTGRLADGLAGTTPDRVRVVHRQVKDGVGRAYVAGMRTALATGAGLVVPWRLRAGRRR